MKDFSFMLGGNHKFYALDDTDVADAEMRLGHSLPDELKGFYSDVGYGFVKGGSDTTFNRLLDPDTIADITLREDVYEFDPDLDDSYGDSSRLIFFEVNEGIYLTMDLTSLSKSPIYYFDTKIADSLFEFMSKLDRNPDFLFDID